VQWFGARARGAARRARGLPRAGKKRAARPSRVCAGGCEGVGRILAVEAWRSQEFRREPARPKGRSTAGPPSGQRAETGSGTPGQGRWEAAGRLPPRCSGWLGARPKARARPADQGPAPAHACSSQGCLVNFRPVPRPKEAAQAHGRPSRRGAAPGAQPRARRAAPLTRRARAPATGSWAARRAPLAAAAAAGKSPTACRARARRGAGPQVW
jgi:hypothetical protein